MAKEFFETTGTEVKAFTISPDFIGQDFYTYHEEWELYIKQLQSLPNRFFYAKHKIEGGVIPLLTEEIVPVYELAGIGKEIYEEILNSCQFGKNYLKPRRKSEAEKTEKKKAEKRLKTEKVTKESPRTLEEIIASMPPLEKAILWAIGTGNYNASEIFEEGNKKLKAMGHSTCHYSDFKKKFYEMAKLPPEGKGLIEFTKRGRSFYYWLSEWGEIAFAEKFGIPSDRAMNEMGGGGKLSKAVALEVIKEWLEPEGYTVKKEDLIETDLTESHRGYTDLVAEKDGKMLRIEIEHRSPKEQIERNIRKNLEISDELYIIASDEIAKKKAIQVALKVLFRLRKEKPDRSLTIKIATIDELKRNGFKKWFEVMNK